MGVFTSDNRGQPTPRRIDVYIDETGDRGNGPRSSPIFGMAAVIVPATAQTGLRRAIEQLRGDFKVPAGRDMSWKNDVKTHDRRKRAAHTLAAVPGIELCYVYARKADLQAGTYRDDPTRMYNYLAYRAFKAALWAGVRGHRSDQVHIRFGHVRRHDHRTTEQYIRAQASADQKVPMSALASLRWVSATTFPESQAADLYGGFLKAAVWPAGEFNTVEPAYLTTIWSQLRRVGGCSIPLGIHAMPSHAVLTDEPWFPCPGCTKKALHQSP